MYKPQSTCQLVKWDRKVVLREAWRGWKHFIHFREIVKVTKKKKFWSGGREPGREAALPESGEQLPASQSSAVFRLQWRCTILAKHTHTQSSAQMHELHCSCQWHREAAAVFWLLFWSTFIFSSSHIGPFKVAKPSSCLQPVLQRWQEEGGQCTNAYKDLERLQS